MQTNHYFENYINNLQKEVFLLAYNSCYEILSFITTYMKSDVRQLMDKPYSSWHNQSAARIFEEVIFSSDIKKVVRQIANIDAVEWLGFFYAKWHFLTGESSKVIIRFLPAKEGIKNYYTLHQVDEMEAIEICKRHYNLSRNNHRSNEYKNSEESNNVYNDATYYSFLAKRMLYRLNKNQIFKSINYVGDKHEYDFIDDNYIFGIKGDVIFSSSNRSIIDMYQENNNAVIDYSRRCINSIYFCFIFSNHYLIDDKDRLLFDINELRKKFPPNNRRFNYIYFYMLGKLYEITPNNELYIYSMPLSKKERNGIINEMRKLG